MVLVAFYLIYYLSTPLALMSFSSVAKIEKFAFLILEHGDKLEKITQNQIALKRLPLSIEKERQQTLLHTTPNLEQILSRNLRALEESLHPHLLRQFLRDPELEKLEAAVAVIVKEVTYSYHFLLVSSHDTHECTICYDEPSKAFCCSSHSTGIKCLMESLYRTSDLWIRKSKFLRIDHVVSSFLPTIPPTISEREYKVTLPAEKEISSCPLCRKSFLEGHLSVNSIASVERGNKVLMNMPFFITEK